jgi:aminoglycoside phosphotransferase (APT) family kinase protein
MTVPPEVAEAATAPALPDDLLAWVSELTGGDVVRADRHVARREAWVIDVERSGAYAASCFLRLDRDPAAASGPWSVRKEARVVDTLARCGLPVPALHGWNDDFQAALYQRAEGRADLDRATSPRQRWAILQQFVRYVADLHRLDPRALGLDDVLAWPETVRDVALAEVDDTEQLIGRARGEPLVTFGLRWLRSHVPEEAGPVTLVQAIPARATSCSRAIG